MSSGGRTGDGDWRETEKSQFYLYTGPNMTL
uniref:Uncharacterized protein n=1 Tax=Arundo donax TaxID=35708 RepID=A0A0A9HPI6_ARUDO